MDGPLAQLADAYGLERTYRDDRNINRACSAETAVAILQALGAPLANAHGASDALRQTRLAHWRQTIDPVTVAWDGLCGAATVRIPAGGTGRWLRCQLELEAGSQREWDVDLTRLAPIRTEKIEGLLHHEYRVPFPAPLPSGYHRFRLAGKEELGEALAISAPTKSYRPPQEEEAGWGVFLPLYALRTERDLGIGDFTALGQMQGWARRQGGSVVGTLPLFASFVYDEEKLFEPSPYSPASRLFWNEIYLDLEQVPELAATPTARERMGSPAFELDAEDLRKLSLVDYRRVMALKRSVLLALSDAFFAVPGPRWAAFNRYLVAHPRAEDYAQFRATCEAQGRSWWCWPQRMRAGSLQAGDYDDRIRRYHLYVQWQADEQLTAVAHRGHLYLDLPLGASSDSYDVWREQSAFVFGVSAGAPPDAVGYKGQDWGFPPYHPRRMREQGYRYFREVAANLMPYAGSLRIDHLAGLHRLFYIPAGREAKDGAYVRAPWNEFYAVLSLESHRHQASLVGEDLGLVPPDVRPAMARHRVDRIYVAQYQHRPDQAEIDEPVPTDAIVGLNTHDLAPFAAFWRSLDIDDRRELDIISPDGHWVLSWERAALRDILVRTIGPRPILQLNRLRKVWSSLTRRLRRKLGLKVPMRSNPKLEAEVLREWLRLLGASPARRVLVNLEDLWHCPDPQNVPGTWKERPNWQRRAWHSLESFDNLAELRETLQRLNAARQARTSATTRTYRKAA